MQSFLEITHEINRNDFSMKVPTDDTVKSFFCHRYHELIPFFILLTEHKDCSTNPCENGARCTEAGAGPFHCFCSWPYYGQRCESMYQYNG